MVDIVKLKKHERQTIVGLISTILRDALSGWEWEELDRGGKRYIMWASGPPSDDGIEFEVTVTYDIKTGMWSIDMPPLLEPVSADNIVTAYENAIFEVDRKLRSAWRSKT